MVTGSDATLRWLAPLGPWTEPDLHLFPQDGHRYEIVDGCLHVTPPVDDRHEAIVRALLTTLRGAAPSGWWACSRPGIGIGASNLVPDVAVLRPESSGAVWARPADIALVVEVESPATSRYDRLLKPAVFAAGGIPAYWRVESAADGPVLCMYALAGGDSYALERTVRGADLVAATHPYPVRLAPATWN